MRTLIAGCLVFAAAAPAFGQLAPLGGAQKEPAWFKEAVKKVEATFDPPEAKPGQTVTFKLTVHLNPGYHTYPLKQPDKAAAGMVNKITFSDPGAVIFVGEPIDPADFKTKPEPEADIAELRYLPGSPTFERRVVVSPKSEAGTVMVKLKEFRLSVCKDKECYLPVKLTPEATLKVLPGPAVEVDKAFADEVKKAAGM